MGDPIFTANSWLNKKKLDIIIIMTIYLLSLPVLMIIMVGDSIFQEIPTSESSFNFLYLIGLRKRSLLIAIREQFTTDSDGNSFWCHACQSSWSETITVRSDDVRLSCVTTKRACRLLSSSFVCFIDDLTHDWPRVATDHSSVVT